MSEYERHLTTRRAASLNRRAFLKKAMLTAGGACLGAGALAGGCSRNNFSADPDLPNFILITADDLGWKDLGSYGNRQIQTPFLDQLANEGVRFTNAFVVSSSCAPSRASLITGQYPHTNGVTALTHIKKRKSLRPFCQTLPALLRTAGYNTALIGKWHPSPYLPTSFYGYNQRLSGLFPKDWKILTADKINTFIRQNQHNRFYIEVNFMQNHRDAYGEFSFVPDFPYDPQKVHVPEYWTLPDWPEIRLEVAKYFSQTAQMDFIIGQVLQELERLNLARNTLVVFLSDNGAPFPGNKMTLYDRGVGTPLMMRWQDKIPGGQVNEMLLNSIDIMPTLLETARISVPADVQGASFLKQMTAESDEQLRQEIFMEMTDHVHYLPTRAIRTHRWKYIRNYSDIALGLDQNNHMEWAHRLCQLPNQPWKNPRVPEEIYDLRQDRNEQVNLAGKDSHLSILKRLRSRLEAHMKRTQDPFLYAEYTRDYHSRSYEPWPAGKKYP
jgi:N-sulfoglucosamine sulfohydrolase